MAYKWPALTRYRFSLSGDASGTIGQLSKGANLNNSNPGGVKVTTSSGDPGINNGGPDPIMVSRNCIVRRGRLVVANASVSQGTTGTNMTARFDLYRVDYSTRTLLGSMDFPIASANVFNDLSANNFQVSSLEDIDIPLSAGNLFGVQFTNRSATNNEINALGSIALVLETEDV